MTTPTYRLSRSTLLWMASIIVLALILAFRAAPQIKDVHLKEALQTGAVTLLYGAILGGFVKVLLDDLDRIRAQRLELGLFISNMLTDLKAVYDRVERARSLILAHRSALTYGSEMRDLIEARVKLLNVIRALDGDARSEALGAIKPAVVSMAEYLRSIVEEFQVNYRDISESQARFQARVKTVERKLEGDDASDAKFPENEPWLKLGKLNALQGLLGVRTDPQLVQAILAPPTSQTYQVAFVEKLDDVSSVLRTRLRENLA
jgi:hypothetical protein